MTADLRNIVVWPQGGAGWFCIAWDELTAGAWQRREMQLHPNLAARLYHDTDAAVMFIAGVRAQREAQA